MNIVLIGIQGSGKGEIIKRLAESMDFVVISVGALLRQEIAKNSAIGKAAEPVMARGDLPFELAMKVLKKAVKKANKDNTNLVFDGFPRNEEQAIELDKICKVDKVIFLKLDKTVAKKRLLNRLTCVNCQYVTSKSETKRRVCPVCLSKLAVRQDDTVEAINKRFDNFEKITLPIVERYNQKGILSEIDASLSKVEVFYAVMQVLK